MEIIKQKFLVSSTTNKNEDNIIRNKKSNNLDIESGSPDIEIIVPSNFKTSDYKIKRSKFPGGNGVLSGSLKDSQSILNNSSNTLIKNNINSSNNSNNNSNTNNTPTLLAMPLNHTPGSSPTGGPPPIKKVISFCLSESIDLMGCFDLLESKGFKPTPFKNLFFFFIKKSNGSNNNQRSIENSPRIISSNLGDIELNKMNSPTLFSLDQQQNNQYYSNSSYPTSPKQQRQQQYKLDEFDSNHSLIVVYEYGVVVCWDLPEHLTGKTLSLFEEFLISPLSSKIIDEMTFDKSSFGINQDGSTTGIGSTRIFKDQITLRDFHYSTKLTLSHSLSQSIKLSFIEDNINNLKVITKNIPSQLISKGKAGVTHKLLGVLTGNIFKIKNSISKNQLLFKSVSIDYFDGGQNNVNKSLFTMSSNYLNIKERTQSIKHNVNSINDMISVCRAENETKSSYRLEMTVIILIAVELLFMVLQFIVAIKD